MMRIGVTGGIGSGKTTVCRFLQANGIPVLYADRIGRSIANSHPAVKKKIRALLGSHAYTSGGTLNRTFVASRVFARRPLQKALNRIVHPIVRRELNRRLRAFARAGRRIAAVEAALIYEAGMEGDFDFIIVVQARTATRLERIHRRDGMPVSAMRRRMRSQWSQDEKTRRADIIVMNDRSKSELRKAVRLLSSVLTQVAKGNLHGTIAR